MIFTKLGALALSFAKIGTVSLGGGNSMIQLIQTECVTNQEWITKQEFDILTGASFLFPGLTAVKISALIGYKVAGFLGLLVSIISLNIPGVVLALIFINLLYDHYENPYVKNLVVFLKYGAVSLLAAATYSVLEPLIITKLSWKLLGLSSLFFYLVSFKNFSPFYGFFIFLLFCFIV